MGLLAERMEICLSICSVIDRLLSAAKSPLPPALQKMQPLVPSFQSRLGQDIPPFSVTL